MSTIMEGQSPACDAQGTNSSSSRRRSGLVHFLPVGKCVSPASWSLVTYLLVPVFLAEKRDRRQVCLLLEQLEGSPRSFHLCGFHGRASFTKLITAQTEVENHATFKWKMPEQCGSWGFLLHGHQASGSTSHLSVPRRRPAHAAGCCVLFLSQLPPLLCVHVMMSYQPGLPLLPETWTSMS